MSQDGKCECAAASTISRYLHQQRFVHFQHPSIDDQPKDSHRQEQRQDQPPAAPPQQIRGGKLLFLVSLLNRIGQPVQEPPPPPDSDTGCPRNGRPIIPAWICRRLTFYRLHWAYFIAVASIATFCLWLFPKPASAAISRLSFIDAFYTGVSVTCTTGLISAKMQDFSVPDTVLMMFLMILGSPIFTSVLPLYFKQYEFRKNIRELEHHLHLCKCAAASFSDKPAEVDSDVEADAAPPGFCGLHKRVAAAAVAAHSDSASDSEPNRADILRAALEATRLEYEAIVALNWAVSGYFVFCVLIGFLVLEVLFQSSDGARGVLRRYHVNPSYYAIFQTISAFTNSGILLLNDSMIPFREYNGILLWSSLLILIGNTMFAPCLRLLVWVLRRCSTARRAAVYDYLLKNPRRCFTHLFPRNQTIWLVVTVMGFNAFESAFFYILSWKSALAGLDVPQKLVNGIFQSITTRSAGENVVSIGSLSPSMLVLYIAMMYIAVYPVYLSRQNSQAEEQLMEEVITKKKKKKKKKNGKSKKNKGDFTIATQSKRLIARDSAFLFISVFVLCIIENPRIDNDPLNFSIFNIIFEVISAYGNVGLSVGYNCSLLRKLASNADDKCVDVPYSFSGKWSLSGKLLMIVIMFLGRHRGLPDNMDSALQIPKSFFSAEQQQQQQQQRHNQQQQTDQFIVEIPALELVETKYEEDTPSPDHQQDQPGGAHQGDHLTNGVIMVMTTKGDVQQNSCPGEGG